MNSMKLKLTQCLFFLLICMTGLHAQTNEKISLKLNNAPLSEALKVIENQSSFRIIFDYEDIEPFFVTCEIEDQTFEETMEDILSGKSLVYKKIQNKTYVIQVSKNVPKQKQTEDTIRGKLIDEKGNPFPYANVVLLSLPDSAFISGTTSNEDGIFLLESAVKPDQIIRISSVGCATIYKLARSTDLGVIKLFSNMEMLGEVTVKANRLRVYSKGGSLVTDVVNSSLKNIGNAKDVLKHIPGIIAVSGRYEVFGKGSPVIYINNKKMRNDTELLMLKSSDILNVEVISNPGAGYDADTRAVIKITTRKKAANGLMMQVNTEGAQSKHFSHDEGLSLSYQWNKLNVFGSYRFDHTKEDIKYDVNQINYETKADYLEESSSKYTDSSNDHSYSAGLNLDFTDTHSIGLQYTGYDSRIKTNSGFEDDWIKMYENEKLFAYNGNALSARDHSRFDNVSFYYSIKPTEKMSVSIDADYAHDELNSHELVEEKSYLENVLESTNTYSENHSNVYAVKGVSDFMFTENHSLQWGLDYSMVKIGGCAHNPEGKLDDDIYDNRENKYAAFAQYQIHFGKFQGNAGLRYEFVQTKTSDFGKVIGEKDYSDILPSLSLSFPIKRIDVSLNFTNRLQRPSFDQLNNKMKYNNQFHQEKGNPNLVPQKIYDLDFNVKYAFLSMRLNYQYIKNYIYTTAERSDIAEGSSIWFTTNAPKYQRIGAMLVASPAWGCWRPTLTAGVYKQYLTLNYLDKPLDYNKPYGLFSLQNEFSFPKHFTLRADLRWNTKGNQGIYYMKSFGYSELSIQKSFFSDNLNLTLRGEDLFNWSKTKDTKVLNYLVSNRATNPYGRRIVFSISWNFNNFKTKYKGTGAAVDEINRL